MRANKPLFCRHKITAWDQIDKLLKSGKKVFMTGVPAGFARDGVISSNDASNREPTHNPCQNRAVTYWFPCSISTLANVSTQYGSEAILLVAKEGHAFYPWDGLAYVTPQSVSPGDDQYYLIWDELNHWKELEVK